MNDQDKAYATRHAYDYAIGQSVGEDAAIAYADHYRRTQVELADSLDDLGSHSPGFSTWYYASEYAV